MHLRKIGGHREGQKMAEEVDVLLQWVFIFCVLLGTTRHSMRPPPWTCLPGRGRRLCSLAEGPFYVFNLAHALEPQHSWTVDGGSVWIVVMNISFSLVAYSFCTLFTSISTAHSTSSYVSQILYPTSRPSPTPFICLPIPRPHPHTPAASASCILSPSTH